MSYAPAYTRNSRRSGLLIIVAGLHLGVLALIMATKALPPAALEIPLIVDLIPPAPTAEIPKVKPLPVSKPIDMPKPVRPSQAPRPAAPVLEASNSNQAAANAAQAAPAEVKPAPAVATPPAAEPFTQARFDADYLRNPAPAYPPLSRRMGEEGKVILRVSVSPQGTAESVEIKTSSGSTRLDEAAQKTVRTWKFIAAKRGDTAIQSWVLVPIVFKLEQ